MVWTPLENNNILERYEGLLYNPIENGRICLGKYRVIFGYRLVGFHLENLVGPEISICCGPSAAHFNDLLKKIKSSVECNPLDNPFLNIPPHSKIKPYYNDIDFCDTLDELYHSSVK